MYLSLRNLFLLIFLSGLSSCGNKKSLHVKTETIKIKSLDEIVLVSQKLVKPLLYTNISGFEKLTGRKAKAKFVSAILPSILIAKFEIDQRRERVLNLRDKNPWSSDDSVFFRDMKSRYRAYDANDLITRIGTLPTSIVLAQAAVESGWGKSRFFLKANNLFGVWSFNIREPRIAAARKRNNKLIYLRAYSDMSQSIIHYFEILARSRSYHGLRKNWQQTVNPFELLPHLKNFSEQRLAYTNRLKKVILRNNLAQFDQYKIDPQYLQEE